MPPAAAARPRRGAALGVLAAVTTSVALMAVTGLLGGSAAGAQQPPAGPTTTGVPTTTVPLATTPPTTTPPTTVPADPTGRQWLVPVPTGCVVPALPDVVFVGTLLQTGTPAGAPQSSDFETARFRVDQARAGAIERFAYDGVVDVRFGADTKYLERGEQYLVGASVDPAAGALTSKVREPEPFFGGDEVIGAAESDVTCPALADPVRTLHTDGTPIEAGVVSPLVESKSSLARALVLPATIAFGVVFALAALRWLLTGVVKGASSVARTVAEPREVRAATRSRPR